MLYLSLDKLLILPEMCVRILIIYLPTTNSSILLFLLQKYNSVSSSITLSFNFFQSSSFLYIDETIEEIDDSEPIIEEQNTLKRKLDKWIKTEK